MSARLPIVSGRQMVKFLEARGFKQKLPRKGGSHIVMVKPGANGFLLAVPDHKELKQGTTLGILSGAGISREEFIRAMRPH